MIAERPYLGLRYFEEKDAHLFYGRDEHVAELLGKLASNRFVAVLGSSGSGKSSFVRAGLLPELRSGMIPKAGPRWKVVEFKPGRAPLGELGEALRTALGVENARELVEEGPLGIVRVVQAAALPARTNVLILADQFEEVFRFQQEDAARALEEGQALVRRLLDAAAQSEVAVYVLLVMRSDYLGECAQFPELPERMSESLYLVPRLRRDQLEEAITAPVGGRIEPAVVQRLLAEVGSDPDQLPRLQHLLLRMWLAGGEPLTMARYESCGGWVGGLEQHLEEVYAGVPPVACARVFRQLSELDKGRAVRRRASLGELVEVAGPEAEAVVSRFRAEGFLAPHTDPVDITHECILREWRRVLGWMSMEQADQKRLQELADAAFESQWPHRKQALSGLTLDNLVVWRDVTKPSSAWARRYGLAVADEYLDFSQTQEKRVRAERQALEARAQAAERERVETEQREALARSRRTKLAAVVLGLAALGFAVLGAWAWEQRKLAIQQTQVSLAGQLAFQSELLFADGASLEKATLLATRAMHEMPTLDIEWRLRRQLALLPSAKFLPQHAGEVHSLAFSPDSKYIATASFDTTGRVVDIETKRVVRTIKHKNWVCAVIFSPDGQFLATGSLDRTVMLTELSSGRIMFEIQHDGEACSLAFSRDGRHLATGSWDGSVRVIEAGSGREIGRFAHRGRVVDVDFSPDGSRLATASYDRNARVLKIRGDRLTEVSRLEHDGYVHSVRFSPDGQSVATASFDQTARVMNAGTGKQEWQVKHDDSVYAIEISPNGKWLASGGADRTLRLTDMNSGRELWRSTQQGLIRRLAFTLDSKWIATASDDQTARLIEPLTGREIGRLGFKAPVRSVGFSRNSQILGSGGADGTAKVTEIGAWRQAVRFRQPSGVLAVAQSENGNHVATSTADGSTGIAVVATGARSKKLPLKGLIRSLAFSADGQFLATGGDDNFARIFDASSGTESSSLRSGGRVAGLSLTRDGKQLAVASWDGSARIVDLESKQLLKWQQGGTKMLSVALSRDARMMAVGGDDSAVHLIAVPEGAEIGRLTLPGEVRHLAFSPTGSLIVAGGPDRTVRIMKTNGTNGEGPPPILHQGPITSLGFGIGDDLVVSGSTDNTARVIATRDGTEKHRVWLPGAPLVVRLIESDRFLEAIHHDFSGNDLLLTRHPLDPQDLIREACGKVTRNLTVAEWRQYVGREIPYARSCDNLPYPPDYQKNEAGTKR